MSQDEAMDKPSKLFREYYPLFYHEVKPIQNVREVLSQLKGCGLRLGVVSQAPSSILRRHLEDVGVLQFFDVVIAQEDCPEQKSSPKPILFALSRLNCTKAAYVGDMKQDIIAGKEADVITVALCWSASYHTREMVKVEKPDYVITDMGDLLKLFCNTEE